MADAKEPLASTWDEAPQQLISTSGCKAVRLTKWRPLSPVDPQFLAKMECERERQAVGHVVTSLIPLVSATHGAKGSRPMADHGQPAARRGPYQLMN